MAITPKPKASVQSVPLVDPIALINRGGSTAATVKPSASKKHYEGTTPVVLRIPDDILKQLDQTLKLRPLKTPRHTWILEAIWEKLAQEQAK